MITCNGLYADVAHSDDKLSKETEILANMLADLASQSVKYKERNQYVVEYAMSKSIESAFDNGQELFMEQRKEYIEYKGTYLKSLTYDQTLENLSKSTLDQWQLMSCSAAILAPAPLQVVEIYFDTATYDEIERDVKVSLEASLGLIGGTMGLLTGFSILSGVEIIFYASRLFMSLLVRKSSK